MKSRLSYYSVQNLLNSSMLSKNVNIKLNRAIILALVLYVCETWSLTLREERRLMFENRVLMRIFGSERDEVTGSGEDYIIRGLMICLVTKYYSSDQIEENEMGGACSTYGGEERWIQGFGGEARGKEVTWKTQA